MANGQTKRAEADPALLPSQALRLAALGPLSTGPRVYADLASEVHEFAAALAGPSRETLSLPLDIMRYEGLIEGEGGPSAPVSITKAGEEELHRLLRAPLRKPSGAFNKLWLALKFRFLELLPPDERITEIDMIIAIYVAEIDMLAGLRQRALTGEGHVGGWLDLEIAECGARLAWCRSLRARLAMDPECAAPPQPETVADEY